MSQLGAANPIAWPSGWDVVRIANVVSPGVCEVSEFKRRYEWDVKHGRGTQGSTITYTGLAPMRGSIKFYLWDDGSLDTGHDHFSEWDAFMPLLKYDPTKKAVQALDIYHPSLDTIDVHSVIVESIGNPVPEGGLGSGIFSITIELLEWIPPPAKSAVATPTTAVAQSPDDIPGEPDDAVGDAQQQVVAGLLARAAQP